MTKRNKKPQIPTRSAHIKGTWFDAFHPDVLLILRNIKFALFRGFYRFKQNETAEFRSPDVKTPFRFWNDIRWKWNDIGSFVWSKGFLLFIDQGKQVHSPESVASCFKKLNKTSTSVAYWVDVSFSWNLGDTVFFFRRHHSTSWKDCSYV